jgi:hypothetical protein
MNFILWLVGITEALIIIYFISRYLSVLIEEKKKSVSGKIREAHPEAQRYVG